MNINSACVKGTKINLNPGLSVISTFNNDYMPTMLVTVNWEIGFNSQWEEWGIRYHINKKEVDVQITHFQNPEVRIRKIQVWKTHGCNQFRVNLWVFFSP